MFHLKTAYEQTDKRMSSRGFTLLEVMVCVSIIALVFVSLFRIQAGAIQLASATRFSSMAPLLSRQVLTQIEQNLENWSQTRGDFGEKYPDIEWTCDISDVLPDDLNFLDPVSLEKLKQIKITITGSSGQRIYAITTWRAVIE